MDQFANLPRCAAPVASYLVRYKIQHTAITFCLASYSALLLVSRDLLSTMTILLSLSALTVRQSNYLLTFSIHQFGMLQLSHHSLLQLSDRLCWYPFGLQHWFTTYRHSTDGTCFRYQRVKSCLGFSRWATLVVQSCRKEAFVPWDSYLSYPMTLERQSL